MTANETILIAKLEGAIKLLTEPSPDPWVVGKFIASASETIKRVEK